MNEPTDPIDLGVWDHDDAREGDQENPLEGQPSGEYHLYAERIVEKPLNERMAGCFVALYPEGKEFYYRLLVMIDRFDLVERSKLPDPVAVPEWLQRWLDSNVSIGPVGVSGLKAWIREAVIAGAVLVEKPEVPEVVLDAARYVADNRRTYPFGIVAMSQQLLEQAGDSDG
ncbi:MAG: hypothetical protein GY708_09710 [Actinomycetia bacterium]|nr:hypothetical protein [Actinomycetes bacterium]